MCGSARVFQLHDGPRVAVTDEAGLGSLVRHRERALRLAETQNQGQGSYRSKKTVLPNNRGSSCGGVRGDAASKTACVHANGRETRYFWCNNTYGIAKPRHLLHPEATTGDRQLPMRCAAESIRVRAWPICPE